jgi:nucleotide-binding universal stress UspA family protein
VVVDEGDAASRICDTAASAEVDLVVVGTNDRGLFERMWMGSVSRRVVAAAPCPVLVVR